VLHVAKLKLEYDALKRVLDFSFAGVLVVLLSPILLITALFVLVFLGRPVIFRQPRLGLRGKPFIIYKFRTMLKNDGSEEPGGDATRHVPAGRFLRALSLDELPQLWNVLKGDMSFVGPRPLLVEYLPLYTPEQARRMEVRPGITGLAQAEGRNSLSWEEKFALDLKYVDDRSLSLDTFIVAKSLLVIVRMEGVNPRNQEVVPRFTGRESSIQRD
jgi:lipopolysaccharide/colanic/teichoic acid biosynthesis glycosyltransferase